jgi:hypothetical protein
LQFISSIEPIFVDVIMLYQWPRWEWKPEKNQLKLSYQHF